MAIAVRTSASDTAFHPLTIEFPESDLEDLRARIANTRWPEKEPVEDFTQGVKLETVQALAEYWEKEHDWRKCEAKLNSVPNFITEIDGLDIHFIHVRSKHEDALPIIMAHGWPGSPIELMKTIGPLTDPTAHGGSASDAFHVVIPSMPGYGFSGKPTETGWGPERIGEAWTELMRRLGYTKFTAQGGDWGGLIVDMMGVQGAPELVGIHTNFAGAVPVEIDAAALAGGPVPDGLSAEEQHAYERLAFFYKDDLAYALEMAQRPQTLYGLADSPIGLAAWALDHDSLGHELIARSFAGVSEGLTRDDVLDNLTLYWLTNTAVSSARIYRENTQPFWTPKNVTIPVAVSVFPDEIYTISRRWAEQAYPNLVHYNKLDRGGHFAAWEQPELFTAEVRAGLRSLR